MKSTKKKFLFMLVCDCISHGMYDGWQLSTDCLTSMFLRLMVFVVIFKTLLAVKFNTVNITPAFKTLEIASVTL